MLHGYLDMSIYWMEWLPIVRGNNAMSSYVDFGAFAGKTGPTTSYKNRSTDPFSQRLSQGAVCKPVVGAIYWFKVLCNRPKYNVIVSEFGVVTASSKGC